MTKKKYVPKVRVVVDEIRWELEGSLDNAIKLLQSYKDQYPNKELGLEIDSYDDYGGDIYIGIEIYYFRDKTQEEINKDQIRRLRYDVADFSKFQKKLEERGEKETALKVNKEILKINAKIRELGGSTA